MADAYAHIATWLEMLAADRLRRGNDKKDAALGEMLR